MRRGVEKTREVVAVLDEITEKYQATPAQTSLNRVINSRGDSVVTIPSVTQVKNQVVWE